MRITDVKTIAVNAQLRNWVFVKVETDVAGLAGWGEASLEWKTRAVIGAVEDLKAFVPGDDPTDVERIIRSYTGSHSFVPAQSDNRPSPASNKPAWTSQAKHWAFPFTNCSAARFGTASACTRTWAAVR